MVALLNLRFCCRVDVCVCLGSVSFPRGAMGWSVIFECGISLS